MLLAKVTLLESFAQTALTIVIPDQVRHEYRFRKRSFYAMLIEKLVQQGKIIVRRVDSKDVRVALRDFRLDRGEAAAFALYRKDDYDAILTDDGEFIKLCRLTNVAFMCAMAITIRMHEKGLLSRKACLDKLEKLHAIGRYSKEVYDHFVNQLKKR